MGGGILVGRGTISQEQLSQFLTDLPSIVGGFLMLGTTVYGLYVKWNTKTVSAEIGAKPSVPTLSSVTGATEVSTKK